MSQAKDNDMNLEAAVFSVLATWSLVVGNQLFGVRAASISRVEVCDQGDVFTPEA
jgi:hypothetical protein